MNTTRRQSTTSVQLLYRCDMQTRHIPVKENANFVKDVSSGALLNTNSRALQAYKKQRNVSIRMDYLEQKMTNVENALAEVLAHLRNNR